MRVLYTVLLTLILALPLSAGPRYNIVPTPRSLTEAPGEFTVNRNTALVVEDSAFAEIAGDFKAQILSSTGFSLEGKGQKIIMRKVEGLGKEEYRLKVSPSEILVEATEVNGAFYGLQTLLQLLP